MESDRRVALIIGCGTYSVGKPLDNPSRDATAMEACFKRLGFHEVTRLRDPKLGRLGRALADFAAVAEDAEMAAIYFAGHGIEANGNNDLIPCDAELGHARRLDFEAVKLADIMRAIDNPRRHLRLIILDACRNNPYRDRMRGLEARRSVEGGLGYVEPRGNMLVAYAAEHGRTALDGDRDGNSPYAKALLTHLETPNLDIRLVFGRVRDDVVRHTKDGQTPHLYGTLGGQEIYLKANGASVPAPPQAAPQSPLQPSPQPLTAPQRSRADQLWDEFTIGTTMEPELIQAYVGQMERDGETLAVWKARKRLEAVVAELKRQDEVDWGAAVVADTEAAYQYYLKSRPFGLYATDAKERAALLEEKAAWKAAFKAPDAQTMEEFLGRFIARFPQSTQIAEAQERLNRLQDERLAAQGFVQVAVWTAKGRENRWIAPGSGEAFRDFEYGPEMVIVPRGEFMMGSTPEEMAALTNEYGDYFEDEGPQHRIIIPEMFAIGRFAVTFAEWDVFVAAKGGHRPSDEGWGRGERPVIHVNWDDTQAYLAWLSEQAGTTYRLPSEAEWEYAARAATVTPFWWGASISTQQANYDGNYACGGGSKGEYRQKTVPVKFFEPNPWGLYQVHGNVWEWCADNWTDSYRDKPDALKANGGAWTTKGGGPRGVRGGSWDSDPQNLRSANRGRNGPGNRNLYIGFRVVRSLTA